MMIGYCSTVSEKSFPLVLKVVKVFGQSIFKNCSLYIVVNQVLKSGTSIGANVAESRNAVSKSDFINKLAIIL